MGVGGDEGDTIIGTDSVEGDGDIRSGGRDRVVSSISLSLESFGVVDDYGRSSQSSLGELVLAGTADLSGIGNSRGNLHLGNAGDHALYGGTARGADLPSVRRL